MHIGYASVGMGIGSSATQNWESMAIATRARGRNGRPAHRDNGARDDAYGLATCSAQTVPGAMPFAGMPSGTGERPRNAVRSQR